MKIFLKTVVLLAILGTAVYGLMYKSPQRKAFEAALAAAQNGDARAQASAGKMYLNGEGTKPDVRQAEEWLVKAAAQGDTQAAYSLAQLYLSGEQTARDVAGGVAYLKMSAEKGYAAAQYLLGRLYQTGAENLSQNQTQAVFWWLRAARQNDADAQNALNAARTDMPEIYAQAEQADQWLEAALQGDVSSALSLAREYQAGTTLEKNEEQAVQWFSAAAGKDNPQAQYELFLYYSSDESPLSKDEAKVADYLSKSAENGYAPAQYALGERLY